MNSFIKICISALLLNLPGIALAEIAVITHPSLAIVSLQRDDVARIFLGKSKTFANGSVAVPINQDEGTAIRNKFNETVCKKNSSQYIAYWSTLAFTGKGTPPRDAGDDAAVKKLVAANPTMIGYIDAAAIDGSVRVVYRIP